MRQRELRPKPLGARRHAARLAGLAVVFSLISPAALGSAAVTATPSTVAGTLIQTIHTSQFGPPAPDPAGITYLPATDTLMVSDSEVDEMTIYQGATLYRMTRTGSLVATGTTLPWSKEATDVGHKAADNTLFVADDDKDRINIVRPGTDGAHGTADDVVTFITTTTFGSTDAEGVEYDPVSGHLFVADGVGVEIYDINPVNGVFADGNDVVTHFDLAQYGGRDSEGIGYDAQRDLLIVIDPSTKKIYEVTKAGVLVRIVDVGNSVIPWPNKLMADVTVAPTSNAFDSPAATSFWIADRQVDNGENPNENDGKVYEVTAPSSPPVDAPPTVTVTAPAEGATVSGAAVSVQATASDDNGVTQVQFFVDGASIGTDTNGVDGWSATWNSTSAANGAHTVTATARDTASQTASDANAVTVSNGGGTTITLDIPVAFGYADAEQLPGAATVPNDTDLDLVLDTGGTTAQFVGLRFAQVTVPKNAVVTNAWVQFRADEAQSGATTVTIRAHAGNNAPGFTTAVNDISSRKLTNAAATWSPEPWTVLDEVSLKQRTPNINAVIQEIVNRSGWISGKHIVLVITGTGKRTADSFEGGFPPVLHIEYTAP